MKSESLQRQWLALPALLWFAFFIFVPMMIVGLVSIASRGPYGGIEWVWTLENLRRALGGSDLLIFLQSLWLAGLTTISCAVIGTLMAWAMATAAATERKFYIAALALPFLTNLVIRIYALRVFVGVDGPLQRLMSSLQIAFDPFAWSQNPILVFYGMLTTYLPFFVFPFFSAFEKFDFSLIEAAQDLGAGPWRILFSVILPNLKTALQRSCLLVFIPALGEYVIPDLLGGAKTMLFGNLVADQFLKSRDWPQGAALAVVLMSSLGLIFLLITVFRRRPA